MSVKAINPALNAQREFTPQKQKNKNNQQYTPSFRGFSNPITLMMDAIDRGGFAASFIAQDGIGMVAPRIWEGLNRNRKREIDPKTGEPTGKKTGPLNWEFARREGIREILSGPSAFVIPMLMLGGIKKYSGSANNVHVDHINALGKSFANFAHNNSELLKDTAQAKEKFYERVFKNVLGASLDNKLAGEELDNAAKSFTRDFMDVEKAPSKGFWKTFIGKAQDGSTEDLQGILTERYMNLRKQLLPSTINEMDAVIQVEGTNKKVKTNFSRFLSSLSDYSNDALEHSKKFIDKNGTENLNDYIQTLNKRRVGTRVLSIASMFAAVVAFYTVIPKLYNLGLKHDPGLAGLEDEHAPAQQEKTEKSKDKIGQPKDAKGEVAFTGGMQSFARKIGEVTTGSDGLLKAVKNFEFNGASMSVPAMLTLLFGFCLPPRYVNAKSDKEKKEILVRDISSFSAILFGANALSRLTSDAFGKTFGLVLNVKPEDHNKSIFHQVKNYLTPGKGIDVLKGAQIDAKYSNLEGYKDRINGFIDFIEGNGGNAKKVFNMDKEVRSNVETILGKPLKNASISELKTAMKAADDELLQGGTSNIASALKNIYSKFGPNNKFINIAKTCNSSFSFLSTLVLVPLFMIGVARYCENMTKKRVAEEKAAKAAEATQNTRPSQLKEMLSNVMPSQKPSMTGFLNKN